MALTTSERTARHRKRLAQQGLTATLVYLPASIHRRMANELSIGRFRTKREIVERALHAYFSKDDNETPQMTS
jgi:hypothetical protein